MPRLTNNFAAAFAAVIITLVSVQAITVVPQGSASTSPLPLVA